MTNGNVHPVGTSLVQNACMCPHCTSQLNYDGYDRSNEEFSHSVDEYVLYDGRRMQAVV